MLEAQGLSKSFGRVRAVVDVCFAARPGEVTGCLGPNGAGKSTTLRMLAGLLDPDLGVVKLEGRGVRDDLVAYQRRLGYVPEHADVYLHLSAAEYLLLLGRLRALPERTLAERVPELLRLLGLDGAEHQPMAGFSKGMRQKVLLAGALLHDPEVLLLDEPLTGLDVTSVRIVKELLRRLAARGRIILYCSHLLDVVERVCAQVVILRDGRVIASGAVKALRDRGETGSLEALVGALVSDVDADAVAGRIVDVISGARPR